MNTRQYSDPDITKGIVARNSDIYQYLDMAYRENVIKHVLKNSGTREEGEEHYQDVIFEIYLNIKEGKYHSISFDIYFKMISRRRWIDKLRKKKKEIPTVEFYSSRAHDNTIEEIEEMATSVSLIILINKYMQQLSPDEKEYISLYYFANKKLQFIANHFGTTYDYVRLRIHRIRQKLRKLIEEDPEYGTLPNLFTI